MKVNAHLDLLIFLIIIILKEFFMNKFTKFLTIGALALVTTFNSLNVAAHQIHDSISEPAAQSFVLQDMNKNDIIQKYGTYGTRFMTVAERFDTNNIIDNMEVSHIFNKMQFSWLYKQVKELDLLKNSNYEFFYNEVNKEKASGTELGVSGFTREKEQSGDLAFFDSTGKCIIELNVSHNGEMEQLSKNNDLLIHTKFQNENQKEIYRQFIALHERMHCEFEALDLPIQLPQASPIENLQFSELIRALNLKPDESYINYRTLVNENFADVGAISLLKKIHKENNSDLNFVINAIKSQREETYSGSYQNKMIHHFTHFSIQELFNADNITKLNTINNNDDFLNFVIKIANNGAAKSIIYKNTDDFAFSKTLKNEQIDDYIKSEVFSSIFYPEINSSNYGHNLSKMIADKIYPNLNESDVKLLSQYKDSNYNQISSEVAQQLSQVRMNIISDISKRVDELKNSDPLISFSFEQQYKILTNFKGKLTETPKTDTLLSSADIIKNMKSMRNQFLDNKSAAVLKIN